MEAVTIVGDYFSASPGEAVNGVRIVNHVTESNTGRNKIVLQNYLISLLVEGTKVVHTVHDSTIIGHDKFLLLVSGNYLMTEKFASAEGRFQSILIFFTQEVLNDFFYRHADIVTGTPGIFPGEVQIFPKDEFLKNFIDSLLLLDEKGKEIPATLQCLKLEELLLYLCYKYPEQIAELKMRAKIGADEIEIKKLVESSIGSNVTLDELAFLCNLSLSTFKRRFVRLYGMAPSKWFLQRRMELATALLRTGKETPAEVYYKVGYESHSGFTHSFKQVFGVTPTEYRESMIT